MGLWLFFGFGWPVAIFCPCLRDPASEEGQKPQPPPLLKRYCNTPAMHILVDPSDIFVYFGVLFGGEVSEQVAGRSVFIENRRRGIRGGGGSGGWGHRRREDVCRKRGVNIFSWSEIPSKILRQCSCHLYRGTPPFVSQYACHLYRNAFRKIFVTGMFPKVCRFALTR